MNSSALLSFKLCIFFLPFSALFLSFFYPFSAFLTLPYLLLPFLYPFTPSFLFSSILFQLFCCLIPLFTIPQSFISYSFILIKPFYVFISLYSILALSLLLFPYYLFYPCSCLSSLLYLCVFPLPLFLPIPLFILAFYPLCSLYNVPGAFV